MSRFASFCFTYRGALVPLAALAMAAFPQAPEGPARQVVAVSIVVLGVAFRASAVREIGGRGRVHKAVGRALHTRGVFGHVRNPLYVGNTAIAVGGVLMLSSWAAAGLAAAYLAMVYSLVVSHEEAGLRRKFGEAYRRFVSLVPRWGWRFSSSASDGEGDARTAWVQVIRQERWVLLGAVGIVVVGLAGVHASRVASGPSIAALSPRVLSAIVVLLVCAVIALRVGAKVRRKRNRQIAADGDRIAATPPVVDSRAGVAT